MICGKYQILSTARAECRPDARNAEPRGRDISPHAVADHDDRQRDEGTGLPAAASARNVMDSRASTASGKNADPTRRSCARPAPDEGGQGAAARQGQPNQNAEIGGSSWAAALAAASYCCADSADPNVAA